MQLITVFQIQTTENHGWTGGVARGEKDPGHSALQPESHLLTAQTQRWEKRWEGELSPGSCPAIRKADTLASTVSSSHHTRDGKT